MESSLATQVGWLPAFRDGGYRRWIFCTLLGIGQKSLPAVESNGLHGVRQMARRLGQVGVALRRGGPHGGGAEVAGNRIVRRPSEEAFGKFRVIEPGGVRPGRHDRGQALERRRAVAGPARARGSAGRAAMAPCATAAMRSPISAGPKGPSSPLPGPVPCPNHM